MIWPASPKVFFIGACNVLQALNIARLLFPLLPYSESESFETFCPTQLDELLKEALEVEEQLKLQKKELKKRLEGISQTLFNLNNS